MAIAATECTAYECPFCRHLDRHPRSRCANCNYPEPRTVELEPAAYCATFGHDGGEVCLPNTARYERTEFDELVEDGMTIGGCDVKVYSHEYLFRCARCGFEQKARR